MEFHSNDCIVEIDEGGVVTHKNCRICDLLAEVAGLKARLAEFEPERWACCGNERQEIHGDYCPKCS